MVVLVAAVAGGRGAKYIEKYSKVTKLNSLKVFS
jgi:hypothetical protein